MIPAIDERYKLDEVEPSQTRAGEILLYDLDEDHDEEVDPAGRLSHITDGMRAVGVIGPPIPEPRSA